MVNLVSRIAAYLLIGAGLGACADGASRALRVDTEPTGALLTESGTLKKYVAPIVLKYPDTTLDAEGCARVQGFSALWASGATVGAPVYIKLCGNHSEWTYVIKRPENAPDEKLDLQAAYKRQVELGVASQGGSSSQDAVAGYLFLKFLEGAAEGYEKGTQSNRSPRRMRTCEPGYSTSKGQVYECY